MNLLPPPNENPYDLLDKALTSLNAHAARQGYVIGKLRSRSYRRLPYTVNIACDRHGRPRPHPRVHPIRQGSSRATGCLFTGVFQFTQGLWDLELSATSYNNPPSDPIGQPTYRRLPAEAMGHINKLLLANVAPRAIVATLRLGIPGVPDLLVPAIVKDV
jgi:hypothetical protein